MALGLVGTAARPAVADDVASIQASITLDGDLYGMSHHGVFRNVHIVRDGRYAFASVEFGLEGASGRDMLLRKSSRGDWDILIHGKDAIPMQFIQNFVETSQANDLAGARCPTSWFYSSKTDELTMIQATPKPATWHTTWPAEPALQTVAVRRDGKRYTVRVIRTHDLRLCAP